MESLTHKSPFSILKTTYNTILIHPVILFPFCLMAFIQLLLLEILFFMPRQPLVNLFAPLIIRSHGEGYIQYPYNFVLLTNWFNQIQIPLYVIFNSFFLGAMILIIHQINDDRPVDLKEVFRGMLSRYVHLMLAAALAVFLIVKFNSFYHIFARDSLANPQTPVFLRKIIFHGDNLVHLFISVWVTALLAFMVPIIVIEKKNILQAAALNFKNLLRSWGHIFVLVLLPALLYVPVSLLKMSWKNPETLVVPECMGLLLIGGTLILLFIEAIQYTAVTTYYLFQQGR
jgi:hypothetical protein